MHAHVAMVSDVALLREPPRRDRLARQLAVLAAGFGAGILTSTVGVASLLSFPVLLAVGLPPVVANASNTVGMTPAGLSGSFGYRRELREHPRDHHGRAGHLRRRRRGRRAAAAGAAARGLRGGGAVADPGHQRPGRHPAVDQPARCAPAAGADLPDRVQMSPTTAAWATLTGVYGGYFGAGSGVMMMAVLGFGLDLELRIVNALKTLAVMAANVVATVIFLFLADLDWLAIGLLAGGSVVGGYVGSHIGRTAPAHRCCARSWWSPG